MRIKYSGIVLQLLLLEGFLTGCKYEDGPAISFRTAENRLKGEYVIDKFVKGGVNYTDSLKKMICNNLLVIHKSGDFAANQPYGSCGCIGDWVLFNSNTELDLDFTAPFILIEPLGAKFSIIWTIDRLSDDEIHLSTNYNNTFIELFLKE